MLDNVKVGPKLIGGYLVVAAISILIGVLGIVNAGKIDKGATRIYEYGMGGVSAAEKMDVDILRMARAYRNMVLFNDANSIAGFDNTLRNSARDIEAKFNYLDSICTKPETRTLVRDAKKVFREYSELGTSFASLAKTTQANIPESLLNSLKAMRGKGDELEGLSKQIADAFNSSAASISDAGSKTYKSGVTMQIILLVIGVLVGLIIGFLLTKSITGPLDKTVQMIRELKRGHLTMRLKMNRTDEIGVMARNMDEFADALQNDVVGVMKKISDGDLSVNVAITDSQDEVGLAIDGTVKALRGLLIEDGGKVLHSAAEKDLTARVKGDYKGVYAQMRDDINLLVKNLDDSMQQVDEAVSQVSAASGEISGGAQSLAEGANEQASSLEEVSSSLEETSSMAKQNADNSNQAKHLATEARGAADEGESSMKRMADAIHQIKTSSDNTAKIVKTIDEIAFQTNLLALNAAVEAARAGEAGKGFAVVAEEVRNLAMRSAEAAKNTTVMIEESVKNAESGVKITEEVAKSLNRIVDRVGKISDLIAEISAASNEQAQGVEQVNSAVAQMNQVTQQNAANSEESASAAEELSSQAAELANMVAAFKLSSAGGGAGSRRSGGRRGLPPPQRQYAGVSDKRGAKPKMIASKPSKSMSSDQLIPLDDEDLGEF